MGFDFLLSTETQIISYRMYILLGVSKLFVDKRLAESYESQL